MKINKPKTTALVLAFLATVAFGAMAAEQVGVEEFNAAFTEANKARKMSGSLGHEWRDTAKFLKQAVEAAKSGNFEKAMKLIAQAKFQSEAAIFQANREASLWEGRVVR